MILKDAPWEKRNLGVTTSIFHIDPEDKAIDVLPYIESCTSEYQEMRVPSGNAEVLLSAQDHGFKVIEMGIRLCRPAGDINLNGIYKRFLPYISYTIAHEIDPILNEIKKGDMFLTDKVALNPSFGVRAAGRRYAFWLRDVWENGAMVVLAKYKRDVIGFTSLSPLSSKVTEGILGGVFPAFANKGLGFIFLVAGLMAAKEHNFETVISHVSSNNLPILKLHEIVGFQVENMEYVLIKHSHTQSI